MPSFVAEHLDGLRLTKIAVELNHEPFLPPKTLAQDHFREPGVPNDERRSRTGPSFGLTNYVYSCIPILIAGFHRLSPAGTVRGRELIDGEMSEGFALFGVGAEW